MAHTRIAIAAVLGAVALVHQAGEARAACHAFTVSVEPASVAEGGEVTVTVARDAAVGSSQVDVETVDGTATGGADYEPVIRRTIAFTTETEQSFPVPTVDDGDAEGAETFRLHLSNPGGCTVNPNFVVGPDVEVTITDNDAAATTAAPDPASPTTTSARRAPAPTAAEPASTSTTTGPAGAVTTQAAERPSTSTTGFAAAAGEDDGDDDGGDDDVGAVPVVLAVALAAGAGAGTWWWWRRRTRPM